MKSKFYLTIFILIAFFSSCGRFSNKQSEADKNKPIRIVCVSKQLTEILFALGEGDKIVGIDISSTYPPETKNITTVGYHRMLSAEGIISLNPTVVYYNGGTNASIGPGNVITQLKKVGIPLKEFMGTNTIDSTKLLIMQVAKEFNAETKAEEICKKLDDDMRKAEEKSKQYSKKPKVLIIHYGACRQQLFYHRAKAGIKIQ